MRFRVLVGGSGHHWIDDAHFDRDATACDDSATTQHLTPVTVPVAANDMGSNVEVTAVGTPSNPALGVPQRWSQTEVRFFPNPGQSGVTTIPYTITDEFGNTATATLTVQVNPVAKDDFLTANEAQPATIDVLANDNGTGLTIAAITTLPSHGTATITAGGIQYTSAAGYAGGDTLVYELGGPNVPPGITATLAIAVTTTAAGCAAPHIGVVNGGFEASAGIYTTPYTGLGWQATGPQTLPILNVFDSSAGPVGLPSAGGSVLASAPEGNRFLQLQRSQDADGTSIFQDITTQGGELVYYSFDVAAPSAGQEATLKTGPSGGALAPVPGGSGVGLGGDPIDWFHVEGSFRIPAGQTSTRIALEDTTGFSDLYGTFVDNIQIGTTTVACPDVATTTAGTPVSVPILPNDQGAGLSVSNVGTVAPAGSGTAAGSGGAVTFTPAANFNGSGRAFSGVATFPYTIADTHGGSPSTGIVSVEVVPVPADDSASTLVDQPMSIDVLANDLGTNIGVGPTIVQPANGTASANGNKIDYTPNPGFRGTDTFTYDLSGSLADPTLKATVTVTVSGDADLEVTLDGTPPATSPDNVPFTVPFVVRNLPKSQASALEPRLAFTLPPGVTLVGGDDCNPATGTCERLGEDLVPGGAAVFSPQFVSTVEGPVTITATASSTTPDDTPGNNTASATVTITGAADIQVTGTISPNPLIAGGPGSAAVTVTNGGPSDLPAGATVTIVLPSGTTVGGPLPPGCTAGGTTTLTCTLPALPNGQSTTVTVPFVVDPTFTGQAAITVTVTPPQNFTNAGQQQATLALSVQAPAPTPTSTTTTTTPAGATTTTTPGTGGTTTTAPASGASSGTASSGTASTGTASTGTRLATTGRDSGGASRLAIGLLLVGMVLVGGSIALDRSDVRLRRP